MKPNIHPKCQEITIKMTDGTKFKVSSTWHKNKSRIMELDVDPKSHAAWLGKAGAKTQERGQVARFMRRFKDLKASKK